MIIYFHENNLAPELGFKGDKISLGRSIHRSSPGKQKRRCSNFSRSVLREDEQSMETTYPDLQRPDVTWDVNSDIRPAQSVRDVSVLRLVACARTDFPYIAVLVGSCDGDRQGDPWGRLFARVHHCNLRKSDKATQP